MMNGTVMRHAIAHLLSSLPSRALLSAIVFSVSACSVAFVSESQAQDDVEVAALAPDVDAAPARAIPAPQANIASVAVDDTPAIPVLEEVDHAVVKDKLTQLSNATKTATWNTRVCEHLGEKTEEQNVKTAWAGTDLQRVKVLTGRAAGKTLLLRGDTVHVGWLKFSHTNSMVQTLRGNSLKLNGFLDDVQHMLGNWDNVVVSDEAGLWLFDYVASNDLRSKMWMDPVTLKAVKIETYDEAGELAGCYTYDSIIYNPKLSAKTWKRR